MLFKALIAVASVIEAVSLLAGWMPGVLAAGITLAYLGSLLWRPMRRCISCQGRGKHGDGNLRRCWTCGGHKEYARWGTMLLRPDVHAQIKDGKHGKNW